MKYGIEKHLIALEGAFNVRDLGGYPAVDGYETAPGMFLRADDMGGLTENDANKLRSIGVSLSIDLRSPREVMRRPSLLSERDGMYYENIPMFDSVNAISFSGRIPSRMGEMYVGLLSNCGEKYKKIFELFLQNDGVSLFHCTAGKDRTGLVAMLLLGLAEVPEQIIVADYVVSEVFLRPVLEQQRERAIRHNETLPEFAFNSKRSEIELALDYIRKTHKSARAYLAGCGLTDRQLDSLLERFLTRPAADKAQAL